MINIKLMFRTENRCNHFLLYIIMLSCLIFLKLRTVRKFKFKSEYNICVMKLIYNYIIFK